MYRMLNDLWWPHQVHGEIRWKQDGDAVEFVCVCGASLFLSTFVLQDYREGKPDPLTLS